VGGKGGGFFVFLLPIFYPVKLSGGFFPPPPSPAKPATTTLTHRRRAGPRRSTMGRWVPAHPRRHTNEAASRRRGKKNGRDGEEGANANAREVQKRETVRGKMLEERGGA